MKTLREIRIEKGLSIQRFIKEHLNDEFAPNTIKCWESSTSSMGEHTQRRIEELLGEEIDWSFGIDAYGMVDDGKLNFLLDILLVRKMEEKYPIEIEPLNPKLLHILERISHGKGSRQTSEEGREGEEEKGEEGCTTYIEKNI
jgi:transcriptional regulator with XRE-family HTH domain